MTFTTLYDEKTKHLDANYHKFCLLKADENYAHRQTNEEETTSSRPRYEKDRDRILYSKEFRRLEGKTQVFVNGFDDHIRNRLTHTLEVSQIAQSLSRHFGFDLMLTEAIALGHDVGHTPFGHVGERELNFFTNNCCPFNSFIIADDARGFKHNWQGLKVVSTLEKIDPKFEGLNLTDHTLWGILHHSNLKYKKCIHSHQENCVYRYRNEKCHLPNAEFSLTHYDTFLHLTKTNSWSFEGLIVKHADEIAQRHHDLEDGLIAGIIDRKELVSKFQSLFSDLLSKKQKEKLKTIEDSENLNYALHDWSSLILNLYSRNLLSCSEGNIIRLIESYNIQSVEDFYQAKGQITEEEIYNSINFTDDFIKKDGEFQDYLKSRILNSHLAQAMDGKASYIIRNIIQAYLTNPKQLPDNTITTFLKSYFSQDVYENLVRHKSNRLATGVLRDEITKLNASEERYKTVLMRTITDFIAGMTDKFAISQYRMLYGSDNYWLR